jgi:hypothetical protein
MFKSKITRLFIVFTLVLAIFTIIPANVYAGDEGNGAEGLTTLPAVVPAGVAAYYSNDGGKHWLPIKEEKGVAEKVAPAMKPNEFMPQNSLPPVSTESIGSREQTSQLMSFPPQYSLFYEDANYTGQHQLAVPLNTSIYYLSAYGMDNMISSIRLSTYADNGCTLFDGANLQGLFWNSTSGVYNFPNLSSVGWNDRASSLVVWWQ